MRDNADNHLFIFRFDIETEIFANLRANSIIFLSNELGIVPRIWNIEQIG